MIGDQYLQARAQLGTALFSLSSLAHGLHAGKDVLQMLHDLRGELREPFVFVVAGEERSGKSSLVNALFGQEIIPADAPPPGDKIHVYKYGATPLEAPVYDQFVEHHRPEALLRDFNIVDTPASSIITHQHLATVDQIVPDADLMIFVFSITNPWSNSSREFLAHLGAAQPRNTVFVLQQCDLRDSLEVEAVAAHLEQVIRDKFPGEHRVFPVSAKKAMLSKTTGTDKEGLFQQSNFGALESYIRDTAIQSPERVSVLRSSCECAQAILADLTAQTRGAHSAIKEDLEILSDLAADLEEDRSQAVRHVGGVPWAVAESYERLGKRGEEIVMEKTKPAEQQPVPPLDPKFEESIVGQIRHSLEWMEAGMLQTWPRFDELMHERFPPGNMAEQPPDLIGERAQLLQQLELLIGEKKSPEHFRNVAPQLFAGIAAWLQVPADEVGRGGLRTLAPQLAKLAFADFHHALNAAIEMKGKFNAIGKNARIAAQFRAEMGFKREELLATVEHHLRDAAGIFHREVQLACLPMQNFCARQMMIYEPRLALAKQMDETLRKTAATLGIPSRTPPVPVAE